MVFDQYILYMRKLILHFQFFITKIKNYTINKLKKQIIFIMIHLVLKTF